MTRPPIQGPPSPDEDPRISSPTPRPALSHAGPGAAPAAAALFRLAPAAFLLLWSTGFTVAKVGLAYAEPLTFLALRYLLAVAALVPLVTIIRPPPPRGVRAWGDLALVGLLIQFGYFALNWGSIAAGAGVSVAALVFSLQPVLVALLAPLAGVGPRVGGRAWLGFALGAAGAAIVIAARSGLARPTPLGVALAVASVMCMAVGTLWEKRAAGRGSATHPLTAALVQYSVGLAGSAAVAALFETMRVRWTAAFTWALLYLVVANSLIAISLLLAMVRRGDAARVSTLFFLVPPVVAVIAWLATGERLPPLAWAGMAVAAAGVLLATRARRS